MITLLDKTYDGESIVDSTRDFSEAFDVRFQTENAKIPTDTHGFAEGEYRVTVTWGSQAIPDFTQLAKVASLKMVPQGSGKSAFLLARLAYMVGALAQYAIANPSCQKEDEFCNHVINGAHLLGQLDGIPVEASELMFKGMLDDLTEV